MSSHRFLKKLSGSTYVQLVEAWLHSTTTSHGAVYHACWHEPITSGGTSLVSLGQSAAAYYSLPVCFCVCALSSTVCAKGSWSPGGDAASLLCTRCSTGRTTEGTGSTSEADCRCKYPSSSMACSEVAGQQQHARAATQCNARCKVTICTMQCGFVPDQRRAVPQYRSDAHARPRIHHLLLLLLLRTPDLQSVIQDTLAARATLVTR